MRLNEYQVLAKSTAQYPDHMKLSYPALGLAGEIFEFIGAMEKPGRDYGDVLAELGDLLWYVAGVASDAELDLGSGRFAELDPAVASTYNLSKYARPILESIKKCFRDDAGNLTDVRRQQIQAGIYFLLRVLAGYALLLNSDLEEVAKMNIEKLKSRKERGVIQGDGDRR